MTSTDGHQSPLVSVVLPTYDRPALLADAVASVAAQRYPNVELIVVDDCSPTPAREVLAAGSWDGLQWRCLRHESNRGANAARNTGIREANGEFVAFLDDDDYWKPGKLDAQMSLFRRGGEEVGVTLVAQVFVNEAEEVTTVRVPKLEGNATPGLLAGDVGGTFSSIAVRRSVVDAAGLPDERFPSWQDREWLIRLSRHCEFASDPRPLVVRQTGAHDQISDDLDRKRDVSYPLLVRKHRDLATEYGRERQFVASLTASLALASLDSDRHDEARALSLKAIRADPRTYTAYVVLLLSLTGPRLYDTIVRAKRASTRFERRLRGALG